MEKNLGCRSAVVLSFVIAFVGVSGASPAAGEETFGTVDTVRLTVPASAFVCENPSCYAYSIIGYGYLGLDSSCVSSTSLQAFRAPVNLPNGALVTGMDMYFYDSDTADNISATLWKTSGASPTQSNVGQVSSAGSSGYGVATASANTTVDNTSQYELEINQAYPLANGALGFRAVVVEYKLQVSPAPAVASFADVPTSSPIFRFVEALKASGITAGCDATHYCPNDPLTRGQMAVFLSAALGLHWPN